MTPGDAPLDSYALCGACWGLSPYVEWKRLDWDDEHETLHPSDGEPAVLRCPLCGYDHTDDDAGPGVWEGSRLQMVRDRRRLRDEAP